MMTTTWQRYILRQGVVIMSVRDWFKPKKGKIRTALALQMDLQILSQHPETKHLFIHVSEADILSGLDAWKWLPLSGLSVLAVSAFGEVFLRNADGEIFQIDTIEGALSKRANSLADLTRALDAAETRDEILLAGLVMAARQMGLNLSDGECYDFKIAPVLGGPMDLDHVETTSFAVKLNLAGQIHEQVKDLPQGTEIEIKIV